MAVSNFASAELLIEFLDEGKFLSAANEVQCSQLLTLALAVDGSPDNAALHREFRAVADDLRGLSGLGADRLVELMGAFADGSGS